jgi:phosphatidylglycerophosphate synthase
MSRDGSATLWIASAGPEGSGVGPETPILGLPLLRRAVLAGERAGFSRILVEETSGVDNARVLAGTRAEVVRPADPKPVLSGRLVVLSSRVVPQTRWLRELRLMPVEAGHPGLDRGCAAVLETEDLGPAVSILARRGPSDPLDLLARHFRTESLDSRDRFEITGPGDLARAEKWLLKGLVKDSEGFMSRHVERPISLSISRWLSATGVSPNTMTVVSVAVGLSGAALFLSSRPALQLAGALLVLAHSILDGCDGELARLKFQESRFGGVLDFWGDNVVHSALFAAISVEWSRAAGQRWPLALGASAILGTLLSAALVYWLTMRRVTEGPLFTSVSLSPEAPLSRVADALARRDFLYLLVILAALGKAHWFLALAAAGSPIYFFLLVMLAAAGAGRRRRARYDAPTAGAQPGAVGR